MTIENTSDGQQSRTHRIGKIVLKIPTNTYRECLKNGVTDTNILYHKRRYETMGIPSSYPIAALRALEDKKKQQK